MKRSTAAHLAVIQSPGLLGYKKRRTGKHRKGRLSAAANGRRRLFKVALDAIRHDKDLSLQALARAVMSCMTTMKDLFTARSLVRDGSLRSQLALVQFLEK